MDIALYALSAVLVLLGLAGTVFPALPGLPLMLAGFALAGWVGNFQLIGATALVVLGVLTAVGLAVDFVAGLLGAKMSGASRKALWGALIGSVVGVFFGLAGLILGPLVGAGVGEFLARRDLYQAGRVGIGTFAGFIVGTVAKIGCAFAMLAVFAGALLL
ncbi:hypothetical protein EV683_10181 [Crenobacter luteus]|uniref:DUF456 domain-containing protein n=1 Tax=Crenobacter luteus TaxID=1452487 RepID=UPI0010452BFB|nr:DUF456 family protein [Crenobacter luteus]TCP15554.1 hypothetical protein EV683_10181 [Crenobacter luteus]